MLLAIFSREQKKLQGDSITLVDVFQKTETVKTQISDLKNIPLVGGWIKALKENKKSDEKGNETLHNIVLKNAKCSRRQHQKYVTDNRTLIIYIFIYRIFF